MSMTPAEIEQAVKLADALWESKNEQTTLTETSQQKFDRVVATAQSEIAKLYDANGLPIHVSSHHGNKMDAIHDALRKDYEALRKPLAELRDKLQAELAQLEDDDQFDVMSSFSHEETAQIERQRANIVDIIAFAPESEVRALTRNAISTKDRAKCYIILTNIRRRSQHGSRLASTSAGVTAGDYEEYADEAFKFLQRYVHELRNVVYHTPQRATKITKTRNKLENLNNSLSAMNKKFIDTMPRKKLKIWHPSHDL